MTQNALPRELQERIDQFVAERMDQGHVPGLSLTILQGGQTVYVRGYGRANLETGAPMTGHTRVSIGSTTKSMTALALMHQVEQGHVDLEAPVTRYLPWFRTADGLQDQILVKHLLSHTSGLPGSFLWDGAQDDGALERRVRALAGVRLNSKPGSNFEYSNDGFAVAGLILQQVSGALYEEAMARTVFQPLEMAESTFDKSQVPERALAQGYVWTRGEIQPRQQPWSRSHNPAGSALFTSAQDVAQYLGAMLAHGKGHTAQVVSPQSVDTLWRPVSPMYGMGWYVASLLDKPAVFHQGDVLTSASSFLLLPDEGLAVATLANLDTTTQWEIAQGVAALLTGAEPPSATPLAYRAPSQFKPDRSVWPRYVGTYSTIFGKLRIYIDQDRLMAASSFSDPEMTMELEPYGDNDFTLRNDLGTLEGTPIEFHHGTQGQMEIWMGGKSAGKQIP
ncbi:serine hydrolase domain-containing protein [Hyalangium versicolor]|uniref:serine hydrolase domain-containing protein n=1 Tax=Hyalangium versicolor TaxID=2861190 RepID=UPI001CCF1F22|nr:serine hydrolase domain-containing protein [Hyalangium versicolor]